MIETKDITLGYNDINILDNITLKIPDEKITILIGANGSGKSTLLKAMASLLVPKKGAIYINSQDISKFKEKDLAKKLSILPQSATAPSDLTVYDLVKQGRYPYHSLISRWSKEDEDIVGVSLKKMGLWELKDSRLSSLSGGQKQRAWITLSLVQNTDIIFLDEPTNHLDIRYQIEILELLKELNESYKRTIVMVLHDINYAIKYANYIIALKDGKIYSDGNKEQIISQKLFSEIFDINCKLLYLENDEIVFIPVS